MLLAAGLAGRAQAEVVYQCDFSGKGMDKFTLNPYESAKGGWMEKSEKLSGSSCLAARGENEYYQYFARIRPVMLKSGKEYRLHVSAKKTGGGSCVVHFFMLKNGNLTSPPQSVGIRVVNSDCWKHYQRSLTIPEGLEGVEIRFRLCNADENAVVYLDDLKIEAASPKAGPDPAKPNLIYECDFDEKMGDRIRLDKKMGGRLSDEQKLSHEYALSAVGNKNYYQVIAFVSNIPFRPGKTYKASVWAKGTGPPASVNPRTVLHDEGQMGEARAHLRGSPRFQGRRDTLSPRQRSAGRGGVSR